MTAKTWLAAPAILLSLTACGSTDVTGSAVPPASTAPKPSGLPEALKAAESLHDAWAKPGVPLPPQGKVTVDQVSATGDQVTVPDTAVKLDGRTLHSLELIGSTGNTGSFSLTFKVQKHEAAWYVQGFDLNA